jgi:hypothetical protein
MGLRQPLASIPANVLEAVTDNSLPHKILILKDLKLVSYLQEQPGVPEHEQNPWCLNSIASEAPGIYMRYLTDGLGKVPTPNQYTTIIQALCSYAAGDVDEALKIDNVWKECTTRATFASADPYYLERKNQRAGNLITWCRATETMCIVQPDNLEDEPSPSHEAIAAMQRAFRNVTTNTTRSSPALGWCYWLKLLSMSNSQ